MNKRLKNMLIFGGLFFLLFFLIPEQAGAITFGIGTIVSGVFKMVAYFFNFIGAILFSFAGFLVNTALELNFLVMSDSNQLIVVGWKITRDLANLGFVFFMIIIAIAFIIRYESYGSAKNLKNLILAAILINFSFAIAGVFIDLSHVLTKFFIDRVSGVSGLTGGGGGGPNPMGRAPGQALTDSLAAAFGPQRFYLDDEDPLPPDPEEQAGALTEFGTGVLVSVTGLVFTIIFTLIAAIVLLGLALMLLARYLWLSFLIIIAPMAWLFWVVPELSGKFKQWWDKFLQWTFFAPIVSFFMYLSLVSIEELGKQVVKYQLGSFSAYLHNIMTQGAQMIVVAGMMIGGIMVAQQMGIAGAGVAMGLADKMKVAGINWGKNKAIQLGTAPFRSKFVRNIAGKMGGVGKNIGLKTGLATGGLANASAWYIRKLGQGMNSIAGYGDAQLAGAKKKLEGKTTEEKLNMYANGDGSLRVSIVNDVIDTKQKLDKSVKQTNEDYDRRKTGQERAKRKAQLATDEYNTAKGTTKEKEMEAKMLSAKEAEDRANDDFKEADKKRTEAHREQQLFNIHVTTKLPDSAIDDMRQAGYNTAHSTIDSSGKSTEELGAGKIGDTKAGQSYGKGHYYDAKTDIK